jgi:hypothetical protein
MNFYNNVAAVYDRRWLCLLFLITVSFDSHAQTNSAPSVFFTNAAPVHRDAGSVIETGDPQTDPFDDPFIKQVHARYEKVLGGDAKEGKSLTADLEKWTAEQPTNFLLQAYLGSTYTLDSRDAWPGPGKITYLKNGGKWLDGAVNSAPDNPAVRFLRAMDYYELPFFFGKGKTARDDFQILLKQIDGEVATPYVLNTETQQAIYYYAGLNFKQLSQMPQAKDAWVRGYKLDDQSDLGKKIGDELMKVK